MRNNESQKKNPIRIGIFVDYWNFINDMRELDEHFRADWHRLRDIVAAVACGKIGGTCFDAALGCFASFKPWIPEQCWLMDWAKRENEHPGGIRILLRKWHCEDQKERYVDVDLAVAMTNMAADRIYDAAVLISKDRDLELAVRAVRNRGIEVIHGRVGDGGFRLSRNCSGQIDVGQLRELFEERRGRGSGMAMTGVPV
ncbi:MAG: NYN domain-containing protein [Chloroflexi bacterium]|nr:NYN domain-containing protein [Chloroflexota bacterium]